MLDTISKRIASASKRIAGAVESAFADTVNPRGRPSWSGVLRLSFVTVPIKAYAAQRARTAVAFNQIHANCGKRIQYQKRCPVHGAVDAAEITHGFQYAPDQYVLIEPDERDKSRPFKDKTLVLEQFIPTHGIDPVLYAGRSLYLLPDGAAARHSYAVLAEAMQNANKWALGKVVLTALRQLVLVRPLEKLLVMDVLHYPRQVHRPEFTHFFANLWHLRLQPFLAGFLIDLEILPLRLLISQASVTQSPPDCILRDFDFTKVLDHLLQASHRPQIGLIAKIGCWKHHDPTKIVLIQFIQQTWPATTRFSSKTSVTFRMIVSDPTKQCSAIDTKRVGNLANRQPPLHGFHCTNTNIKRREPSLAHDHN